MKRLHFLLPMVLLAMLSLTFSSCEIEPGDPYFARYEWWDDSYRNPDRMLVDMARTLRGRWQGTLVAKGLDGYGRPIQKNYLTQIEFDQYTSMAIYGRGIQSDYRSINDPNPYTRRFSWHINSRTGDIYIDYDNNYSMIIPYKTMNLSGSGFVGEMIAHDETDDFNFQRYTLAKSGTFDASAENDSIDNKE